MPPEPSTIRVVVRGRVQGVYYRAWTVREATALGLDGWVRNRRDGSVEAVFSGERKLVERMVELARRGPPNAVVEAIEAREEDWVPPAGFRQLASE